MSGHVFIVHGDLRKFACDAWAISCSRSARPRSEWFPKGYDDRREGVPFADDGPRAQPLLDAAPDRPRPWLVWVGRWHRPAGWYVDG
ncbi:MAG: hypothetical protein FJ034_07415, partial [Chloroflexi bacterium]|nr:hypothetical protein [Chloroflexota bacterium]